MGHLVIFTVILVLCQVYEIDSTCGDYFTTDNGTLSTPNYPSKYRTEGLCKWTINVTDGYVIRVTFQENFYIYHYNNLKIFDVSPNGQRFLKGSMASSRHYHAPPTFTSLYSSMDLELITSYGDGSRFSLEWSKVEKLNLSDVVLRGSQGNLTSPNYPSTYPDHLTKTWEIVVPYRNYVLLTFNTFDLGTEHHKYCGHDKIEIFDVMFNGTLVSLGQWCGMNAPPLIKSSSTRLLVKLYTDKAPGNNGRGFEASWRSDSSCGGILNTDRGLISSPHYPFSYDNNLFCKWTINLTDGYETRLIFLKPFSFESCCDFVKVFDVSPYRQRTQRGSWNGDKLPPPLTSSSSSLDVEFRTDYSVVYSGFSAMWSKVGYKECNVTNGGCHCGTGLRLEGTKCVDVDECLSNSGGCDQICTNTFGSLICSCHPGYKQSGTRCIGSTSTRTSTTETTRTSSTSTSTSASSPISTSKSTTRSTSTSTTSTSTSTPTSTSTSTPTTEMPMTTDMDECKHNNGGCNQTCHNSPGSFYCSCWTGYTGNGNQCTDIDECNGNNGGCNQTCNNTPGSFNCSCKTGYTIRGKDCEDTNECSDQNGGCDQICTNTIGSHICSCNLGYEKKGNKCTGDGTCNVDIDCGNKQRCVMANRKKSCFCKPGFQFQPINGTCEDIDECDKYKGMCDQNCTNTPGSFKCSCGQGYHQDGNHCQDIDECNHNNGGCEQNCINTPGSFNCSCEGGYSTREKQCIDIDECNLNNGGCNQTCTNTPGSFKCSCEAGYTIRGKDCEDIDECMYRNGGCDQTCTNTIGSFICSCQLGYEKKGKKCTGDGTCSVDTDCGNNQRCIMANRKEICSCKPGFQFKPINGVCEDIDECDKYKGMCDQNCTNTPGSFKCSCGKGYHQDGNHCQDIDECQTNNGGCDVTCDNTIGSYKCSCPSGYKLEGYTICKDINECSNSTPCDQTCLNNRGSYTCSCGSGFTKVGRKCYEINECLDHNGGCNQTCTNTVGSYTCSCHLGYEKDVNNCTGDGKCRVNSDCGNNQMCAEENGDMICSCKPGYKFEPIKGTCDDIDECKSTKVGCSHKCENTVGSYRCTCNKGYRSRGTECLDIDECQNGENGGCNQVCTNTPGSSKCSCRPGYEQVGKNCFDNSCGGNFNKSSGTFHSPRYPSNYSLNTKCSWTIDVKDGYGIRLIFNHFHLEAPKGDYDCYDYLKVSEVLPNGNNRRTRTYCGTTAPNYIISHTSKLKIDFYSNDKAVDAGFSISWSQKNISCGGDFHNSNGTFNSPSFPSNYYSDSICKWTIIAQKDHRIRLHFNSFLLEQCKSPDSDNVKVYDVYPNGNRLRRGTFCGNKAPPDISSSTSKMEVEFQSDDEINRQGFVAVWNELDHDVCGGHFTEGNNNVIAYPSNPNITRYGNAEYCKWSVSVEDGYVIKFYFDVFDLEGSRECYYDSLKITDISSNGIQGGTKTICGSRTPFYLLSSQSRVEIQFQSNERRTYRGFRTTWSKMVSPSCHFKLTGTKGTITPTVTAVSMNKVNCQWDITVPRNQSIHLTFPEFLLNTKPDGSCGDDYIEIFDVMSNSSEVKRGRWCGTNIPPVLKSSGVKMVVKFYTYKTVKYNNPPFVASWEADGSLGKDVSGGTLHSSIYPVWFINDNFWRWTISVKPGHFVKLTFNKLLQLDNPCYPDYVTVFDVLPNGHRLTRGTFCGHTFPPNVTSSTSIMEVGFKTDESNSKIWFSADWFELDDYPCGGNFTDNSTSKVIEHPHSPNTRYGNAEYCKWSVKVEDGYVIKFHFDFLHLENGRCVDTLKVTEISPDGHGRLAKTWCGDKDAFYFVSSTSMVDIEFQSNQQNTYRGFKTIWSKVVPPTCHTKLTGRKGTITPALPPVTMEWVITVPRGHLIKVDFSTFKLNKKADGSCGSDYIEIFDVLSNNSQVKKGHWCGTDSPPVMKSSGVKTVVKFNADKKVNYNSPPFVAEWQADGTTYGDPDNENGTVYSSNYPSDYVVDNVCRWNIDANPGHYIQLTFNTLFDLENTNANKDCTKDHLTVFDVEPNGHRRRRGTWCGKNVPPVIRSSSSKIEVDFISDDSDIGKGFSADWFEIDNAACGGHFTERNVSKVIEYPGSPKTTYGNAEYCKWSIEVEDGFVVQFHFEFLHLDSPGNHKSCRHDTLKITDISTSGRRSQTKTLCGADKPFNLTSSSSKVEVEFQSDESGTYKGFKTIWSKVEKLCGGNFNNKTGTIQSPNYPSKYSPYTSCRWTINVLGGFGIKLVFNDFDLEGSNDRGRCTYDYLSTYEVQTNGYDAITNKFCRTSKPADIVTYNSNMEVNFVSDGSVSKTGFSLSLFIVDHSCGGEFNARTGTLQSPNYPSHYDPNTSCQWTINVETKRYLTLHFDQFKLGGSIDDCRHNYVKITKFCIGARWPYEKFLDIDTYCGTRHISENESKGCSKVDVLFVSGASHVDTGFSLSWETTDSPNAKTQPRKGNRTEETDLGGDMTTTESSSKPLPTTEIPTPSSDTFSTHGPTIRESRTTKSKLMTTKVPYSPYTPNDIKTTREIPQRTATLMTTTLKSFPSAPKSFETTTRESSTKPSTTFNPSEQVTKMITPSGSEKTTPSSACGEIYHKASGKLSTPNYPKRYGNDLDCRWEIHVDRNHLTRLWFDSVIEIESSETGCDYDFVEVFDSIRGQLVSLGKFCGHKAPALITSYFTDIVVVFHSDGEKTGKGFSLTWNSEHTCGEVYHGSQGNLSFPIINAEYQRNMSCRWEIQVDPWFHSIRLHFDGKFDIGLDRLEVSGLSANGQVEFQSVIAGTKPTPQTFKTPRLVVTFTSFDGTPGTGFDIYWEAVCGGLFNSLKGDISSPNYGAQYPTDLDCEWEILGLDNYSTIQLNFQSPFELEASENGNCDFDYIEVSYFMPDGALVSKGKFCGHKTPQTLTAFSSKMVVRFHSDGDKSYRGFSASWEIYCHMVYNTSHGEIKSPYFPMNYPDNFDCRWEIQAEKGNFVKLTFEQPFALENNSKCDADYIELYEVSLQGVMATKGRWCGDVIPPVQQTTASKMVLVFHSDNVKSGKGFHAMWDSDTNCGETFIKDQGFLTTPNYPYQYPENSYCRWEINPPAGGNFVLKFNPVFDLEKEGGCSWDYVQVIRGDEMIGQWCGKVPPQPVESHGEKVMVIFKSDKSYGGKGFFASWKPI